MKHEEIQTLWQLVLNGKKQLEWQRFDLLEDIRDLTAYSTISTKSFISVELQWWCSRDFFENFVFKMKILHQSSEKDFELSPEIKNLQTIQQRNYPWCALDWFEKKVFCDILIGKERTMTVLTSDIKSLRDLAKWYIQYPKESEK